MADVPSQPPHKVVGKGLSAIKNLPPWAIVLAVGGFVVVFIYMRGHSAGNSAAAATTADTPPQADTSGFQGGGYPYPPSYPFLNDPSMAGGNGLTSSGMTEPPVDGSLPNGTGAPSNPTDAGTTNTYTYTSTDSHNTSDSHDASNTFAPVTSYGDINSPLFSSNVTTNNPPPAAPRPGVTTGGGAPNRPTTHTVPHLKPAVMKPKPPAKKPPKPKKKPVKAKAH